MKMNKLLAVLLTALFLVPFFPARAEETPAFTVDENVMLRGMDRTWLQGYTPAVERDRWILILPVRSEAAAGTVQAELVAPTERTSLFKPSKMTSTAREETKGVWGVRFTLEMYPDQKNADYACTIRLTGKDRDGNPLAAEIPYTLRIRGAKENAEKSRIEAVVKEAELSVGERGTVRVCLTNPCERTDAEDLTLKISDGASQILPDGAETLKIGSLPAGASVTVDYPVTVTEKAAVEAHVLKMDLEWNALGQTASCSAHHTVTVSQEIRLEQGGLKMAPSVVAGDSVSLTLPLMNMGKADVVNVLATVVLPGVTERQSVLVGTICPGETKQAQLVLTPAKDLEGEFSGSLEVKCTDRDGNPASFSLPVNLTVEKPVKKAETKTAGAESAAAGKQPVLVWGLAGACALLAFAMLAQGTLLRRKLHLAEEAKL